MPKDFRALEILVPKSLDAEYSRLYTSASLLSIEKVDNVGMMDKMEIGGLP